MSRLTAIKGALKGAELGQRALSSGSLAAVGAGLGAASGGALGGVQGYRKAKEEGGSRVGGALRGALGGAGRGAAVGGLAGGAAGALGGGTSQRLTRELSGGEGRIGRLSRFGERQVHSLTGALPAGMTPAQGRAAIGANPSAALKKELLEARTAGGAARQVRPGVFKDGPPIIEVDPKHAKTVSRLEKAVAHAEKTEELGATSVPGLFKALAKHPTDTIRSAVGQQWHGSGRVGKAMAFGLPTAMVGAQAARSSKPGEESRGKRMARAAVDSVPFMAAPAMGILGSSALGMGASKLMGKKPHPQVGPLPEDAPSSGNVERVLSPGAQGKPPEGFGG